MFHLVFGDFEFSLALPLEAHIEERLYRIISVSEGAEMDPQELARRAADMIAAAVDAYVIPPTLPQIRYALAIAEELAVELPANALRYRESMKVFISTHAPTFKESKAFRRAQRSAE